MPDPTEAFGFGRRICAGRHFAEHVLWLTVANVLAVFALEEPCDAAGRPVKAREEYTTGMFRCVWGTVVFWVRLMRDSMPKDLRATFKPRSAGAARLIRSAVVDL